MEFPFTAHAQSRQESLDFTSYSKENMYVNLNEFKLYYFLKSHCHNMITSDTVQLCNFFSNWRCYH